MLRSIRGKTEEGSILADLILSMCGIAGLVIMVLTTFVLPLERDNNIRGVAYEIETWSIAHPASPVAYEPSFPLEQFIEESGSDRSFGPEYTVNRVNTPNHNLICFVEKKDKGKVFAYSYQVGNIINREVCGE